MILSQLVDSDELGGLSPEELRDMILALDDQVLFGEAEAVDPRRPVGADPTSAGHLD